MWPAFKDVVGVLLLAFLLPAWMALGLGAVVVVVARQLYWWARGNTTVVSRVAAAVRSTPRHAFRPGTSRAPAHGPLAAAVVLGGPVTGAAGALSPAVPGVSER